jgi:predicted amidohydrolase YtcJ
MKLWKNGYFHSMKDPNHIYHQMATNQGIIVGFDDEIINLNFDETIDLKGTHVYPGFVDAHLHMLGYGQMLGRIHVIDLPKDEVIKRLKLAFDGKMLYAEGYKNDGLSKHDLNQISDQVPIYVRHNDYHSLTVNDYVLNQNQIESESGFLTEDEANLVLSRIPKFTLTELEKMLEASILKLYQFGLTGGHTEDLYYFNGFDETLKAFENVLEKYPFRVIQLIHHETLSDFKKSQKSFLDQTPYLALGGVKMFYDGTISSKTALMFHPFKDTNSNGMRIHGIDGFIKLVQKARSLKLPVAVHIIGDLGLSELSDILAKYPPQNGLKDRLIHTPYMNENIIEKLKKLPLTFDIQPQFLSSDMPWSLDYFSVEPKLMFPWKTMLDHGLILSGSSDAPIEIPNPLLGIHSLIYRKSRHNKEAYGESESLHPFDAVKLYATDANAQTYKTNRGLLEKGYIADFSIFKKDLLTMDESEFFNDITYMTVINEKVVYKNNKT